MLLTRSYDLHLTRYDLISIEEAQEITFDIFDILLNFCDFLCFFENFLHWSANLLGIFNIKCVDRTKCSYARRSDPPIPWNIFRAQVLTPKTVEVRGSESMAWFWKFQKKWKPLIGWDTAHLKLKICVLPRDSEPNNAPNSLIWPSFDPIWPHIDRKSSMDHF